MYHEPSVAFLRLEGQWMDCIVFEYIWRPLNEMIMSLKDFEHNSHASQDTWIGITMFLMAYIMAMPSKAA